jgi:hypothetical protein
MLTAGKVAMSDLHRRLAQACGGRRFRHKLPAHEGRRTRAPVRPASV